jgi:hypothetical protein
MQHLDEGTIHSWLDGALSADEAARVQAHVAECPQCAAAVAEARGFIAASSRILTALDNAPRGVIPVAAPRNRIDPIVWRVAATILVVAAGTLVVFRGSAYKASTALTAIDSVGAPEVAATQSAPPTELNGAAQRTTVGAAGGASPSATASSAPTSSALTSRAPAVASAEKAAAGSARRGRTTGEKQLSAEGTSPAAGRTGIAADYSAAPMRAVPAPAAPTGAASRLAPLGMRDAAAEPEQLKVVGSPRQIGARVTLYEVAPGDTVTLTESMPVALNAIVMRGVTTTQMAPQATGKSAVVPSKTRADAAAANAPESRRAGEAAAAAPAPAPPLARTEAAITVNTITWTDAATANKLTLSGRIPEARLQEIKIRIERERAAAAAAAKKNP